MDEATMMAREEARKKGWEGDMHRILYQDDGDLTGRDAVKRMAAHLGITLFRPAYRTAGGFHRHEGD